MALQLVARLLVTSGHRNWRHVKNACVATGSSPARTTAQAPWLGARAAVSVANRGSTGSGYCNRLRRFLRLGLGPGFAERTHAFRQFDYSVFSIQRLPLNDYLCQTSFHPRTERLLISTPFCTRNKLHAPPPVKNATHRKLSPLSGKHRRVQLLRAKTWLAIKSLSLSNDG